MLFECQQKTTYQKCFRHFRPPASKTEQSSRSNKGIQDYGMEQRGPHPSSALPSQVPPSVSYQIPLSPHSLSTTPLNGNVSFSLISFSFFLSFSHTAQNNRCSFHYNLNCFIKKQFQDLFLLQTFSIQHFSVHSTHNF